jgi:hypothetical protein
MERSGERNDMKMLIRSILVVCCWCLVTQVNGADTNEVKIVDFGIYKGSGEASVGVSNSPSGNLLLGGQTILVKQTDKIPAVLKSKFGFRFMPSEELKKKKLKFVYLFPEIKNPQTGQVLSRYEAQAGYDKSGRPVGMIYDFSEKWELVTGEWTFQVFDGDRKVVEKKFTVVKAE